MEGDIGVHPGVVIMSAIPLLLQFPQTPTSPSPLHHTSSRTPTNLHHSRTAKLNNRNSFPPDQSQESRWAALLARAAPTKPYGACSPAPLHNRINTASRQPSLVTHQLSPVIHQPPPRQLSGVNHQPPVTTRSTPVATYQPSSDIHQPRLVSHNTSNFRPLVPTASFNRALTSPTAIKLFNPSRRLNKSQSQLIMPRMKSLFRTGQGSRSAKEKKETRDQLPRDGSVKSLANYEDSTSPEPLIRKCHTVLALSSTSGNAAQTRLVKDKKSSKLDLLRRMSPSKSAVFTSNKMTIVKSPSAMSAMSDLRRLRKDSSMLFPQMELEGEGGGCSRCASAASMASRRFSTQDTVFCKLCLSDINIREMYQLQQCLCRFCKYCMAVYVTLKIREGDYIIECPDANCDCSGELTLEEMESLVGSDLYQLHLKFRKNTEIDLDPVRAWCPMPGCETVVNLPISKLEGPQCTTCSTCTAAVPNDDTIKRCPSCKVPIERDAGCAQMLCKKCKHVFCWYCLASLDDDFLLRHYDKGPCKNKLGHSRASVLWHRAQVIGIFAGFGLLLVVASPLLLFVGPCLLCCKCKPCSKHEIEEDSLYGI
ncbi:E3 ubiquitin-protein ligase RNF144A-A-like [Homarus americanus]|uniref:E3 ubiquitin-protein ligase RNF144B n=1 Tax=Homarus americanus TaxID=6706 RepID=A0A8J5NA36_HOMAM|nr:E3 ubiquitin-protein ligase RNF144A-A-like [Homarus americanus]